MHLLDIAVVLITLAGGTVVSVLDNPLMGAFLLLGVLTAWELVQKYIQSAKAKNPAMKNNSNYSH